jgi:hypothetical protein
MVRWVDPLWIPVLCGHLCKVKRKFVNISYRFYSNMTRDYFTESSKGSVKTFISQSKALLIAKQYRGCPLLFKYFRFRRGGQKGDKAPKGKVNLKT